MIYDNSIVKSILRYSKSQRIGIILLFAILLFAKAFIGLLILKQRKLVARNKQIGWPISV